MYLNDNKLVKNPGIETAITFIKEVLKPSDFHGYYQPFSMISLMIDYSIAKTDKDLYVYHRTSLILHVLNVMLLALLLFVLFKNPYVATLPALLFGIHPMTVETIAWVSERKTTLASFFALFSILFYVLYTLKKKKYMYFICGVTFIFSLLSKPTSTMIPFMLLLMDFWPLGRIDYKNYKSRIIEKIPLFIITFISSIITYLSQKNTALALIPSADKFLTSIYKICYQILYYPLQMIFPHNQTAHYPVPTPFEFSNPKVLVGILGSIALIVFAIVFLKKSRSVLTGFLIFIVLLLPTTGVIGFTSVIMSDKYAYLPSIGFIFIIANFTNYLWGKIGKTPMIIRAFIVLLTLLILTGYSYATRNYISLWKDTHTYYTHMQKLAPDFPGIYNDLAADYSERGDLKEARRNIEIAVNLDPYYFDYIWNLGILLEKMGEFDKAISAYQKAITIEPNNYKPYRALGAHYNNVAQYHEAIKYFENAVRLLPNDGLSYYGLAFAQTKIGDLEQGFINIQRAVKLDSQAVDYICLLGEYYSKKGDFNRANEIFEDALKYAKKDEEFSKIYLAEGINARYMKQTDRSIEILKKAIRLNPKFVGNIIELSNTYLANKMYTEALKLHENAILEYTSNIDLAIIYNSWGYILANKGDIDGAISKFEKALKIEPNFIGAKRNLEQLLKFTRR
jgi:tetratricopeptide (TPR) repeat protein